MHIKTQERCWGNVGVGKTDDGLWGEAQAMYFSLARRFMESDVFRKTIKAGQNNSDIKILNMLKSKPPKDCCGDCGWCTPSNYKKCKG